MCPRDGAVLRFAGASCVCVLNIGLFVYMAFDDERVLLRSAIAADYKNYKVRVGMFVPRFAAKRSQAK
jgi:protein-S-isoprenylcysteine O-methyltransferase Ste14